MTRPAYAVVRSNFPTRARYPRERLLTEVLGWEDLLENHSFVDTCAMRVSTALALSGVKLIGSRMKGKGGAARDRMIEPGQAKLSHILRRIWGAPERYRSEAAARDGIGKRSGVISFFRIHPEATVSQGHIDLVEPRSNGFSECATQCFFGAAEIWFWPLK
ncbi:T6SS effector amidase Tae4 family protein [Pseudoduganella lurida]|uniref:T6SS effector amidase Tae4 family protein n=1 Tax=Pseudoduganella lurida TaxID=1036180 RepID=UPI0011AACC52|nr:T6SS effector amidase Tae4 family protein [Pseudoduganella lurida]